MTDLKGDDKAAAEAVLGLVRLIEAADADQLVAHLSALNSWRGTMDEGQRRSILKCVAQKLFLRVTADDYLKVDGR